MTLDGMCWNFIWQNNIVYQEETVVNMQNLPIFEVSGGPYAANLISIW